LENQKNKRKYLWLYAGVLFLSALAILGLTAFSQMKLSGNDEEYRKKIKERESSIKDFNISLNSAVLQKNALNKRIQELESEIEGLRSTTAGTKNPNAISNVENCRNDYETLLKADSLFRSDKKVASAQILKNIREDYLGEEAVKKLNRLKDATYLPATKSFYFKGKEEYSKGSYDQAEKDLEEALFFDKTAYFEENTLYYLALASSKQGKEDETEKYSGMLLDKYPKSSYIKKIKNLN